MTDEGVKKEEGAQDPPEKKPDEPVENKVETLAKEIGWNPDYDGENAKSAEEYILNGREIQATSSKHMKRQKQQIEDLTRGVADLKTFQETNYKVSVKNMKGRIRDLETQLADAKIDKDPVAEAKITKEITEIQAIPDELPKTAAAPPPEFLEWRDENPWYSTDEKMHDFAEAIGDENTALAKADYPRFLKKIATAVKKEFPDKFEKPKAKTPAAPSVESASRSSGKVTTKNTYKDLTRDQQDACDNFVKIGIMTRDEYIKDLEAKNEVI